MNGWFLALLILCVMNVSINMAKHGEPKENNEYNFFGALFGASIQLVLVYCAIKAGF